MRSGLRAMFFLSVIPCVPVTFALMYWIASSSSLNRCSFMDPQHQVENLVPGKQTAVKLNSDKASSQSNGHNIHHIPTKTWLDVSNQELMLSEHEDIDVRGKFQQERINMFCQENYMARQRKYPEGDALDGFNRHLMFDDPHKVIFCFVPKIGCTNLKRLLLYMGGHLPMETIDWPWVEDSIYLEPALKHASLLNKTLTVDKKLQRISEFYKFMIVRNPLERLVSGFKNKLEKPVRFDKQHNFPETIKVNILQKYRLAELRYWRLSHKTNPHNISVTFSEFIRYVVESSIPELNEHFRPMIDICHPCLIKYSFYGNFRNISHDVSALIKKFGTNPRFYRDESLHGSQEQTSLLLARYYNSLSHRDKTQLLGMWYDDLLFYYTLYPSERSSHKHLLGIDIPIL